MAFYFNGLIGMKCFFIFPLGPFRRAAQEQLTERLQKGNFMEVNTQFTSGYDSAYRSAPLGERSMPEEQSIDEAVRTADVFKKLIDTFIEEHKLTKDNIKNEDDWRKMSDEQWDQLIEHIDKYIDDFKEELEHKAELQKEAIMKSTSNAPDDDASSLEKSGWTYDLQTEDQVALATAKMANEFAPTILTKAQELALTGNTTTGMSESENVRECASLDENDEKKKTWTITAFTEQGIICSQSTDGVTRELWRTDT